MPLDNANFISQLNPSNPNGAVDTVNMLDDSIREVKKCLTNSFPNIDKQVKFSADDLNNLKDNLKFDTTTGFDVNAQTIDNVASKDSDKAVEPRLYNDNRYLKQESNLSDLKDKNKALGALATGIDYTNADLKIFQKMIVNLIYPVGFVYINTDGSNPRDRIGEGTWERIGQGRTLVGEGTLNDGREQRTLAGGSIGGAFTHTLTGNEVGPHSHAMFTAGWNNYGQSLFQNTGTRVAAGGIQRSQTDRDDYLLMTSAGGADTGLTANNAGGQPHNNMQPYLVVYFWKRTA